MSCDDCAVPPDTEADEAWEPDRLLVPAILAHSRHHSELSCKTDKCWVVAALTEDGMVAEEIADRLKCSLRLVRTLLADARTKAFRVYFREAETFAQELALVRHELQVRSVEARKATDLLARVTEQRDQLIALARKGEAPRVCKRNHLVIGYNAYTHPKTKKVSCRTCRRDAMRRLRGNADTTVDIAPDAGRLMSCAPEVNVRLDAVTRECAPTRERAG